MVRILLLEAKVSTSFLFVSQVHLRNILDSCPGPSASQPEDAETFAGGSWHDGIPSPRQWIQHLIDTRRRSQAVSQKPNSLVLLGSRI